MYTNSPRPPLPSPNPPAPPLKTPPTADDPDTNNFFALKQVTMAEVDEWVARAEEVAFGKK
jgi:hypothetical protein